MNVKVLLFGGFRKFGNGREVEFSINPGSKVSDLRKMLALELSRLTPELSSEALIRDSAIANESRILSDHESIERPSTLAILPPVCGG